MKPVVTCKLLSVVPVVGQRTDVRRTSEHPTLGEPNPGYTHTSLVLRVDEDNHVFETLNTLYLYE